MEAVHPGQTGVSYGKQAGRWEEMLGGAQLYFMNISGVEAGKLGVIGNFVCVRWLGAITPLRLYKKRQIKNVHSMCPCTCRAHKPIGSLLRFCG